MADTLAVRTHIDFPLGIGESPLWDDAAGVLWFIDIEAPAIFRLDPATGGLERFDTPRTVASLGLAPQGRLVVALRSGVHLFDPATGAFEFVAQPETGRPMNRLNDGKVGPDGAFWVGSMFEQRPYSPTGALYRVAPDGHTRLIRDGVHVSNGLAWSPDGRVMYHADSVLPEIRAYDFDPRTGQTGAFTQLIALDPQLGRPDGVAVDVEGCYWSAGVTAGRLNRISPEGALLQSLTLPVAWPTMPCFGGPDLRTLFVTSLRRDEAGQVQDGTLISFPVDVAGLPAHRFGVDGQQ